MMEAEEFYTEAIIINISDMIELETNDREMSEIMAEAMHSDSGLMAEEFHSEAISNNSDMSDIVVDENHSQEINDKEQLANDEEWSRMKC